MTDENLLDSAVTRIMTEFSNSGFHIFGAENNQEKIGYVEIAENGEEKIYNPRATESKNLLFREAVKNSNPPQYTDTACRVTIVDFPETPVMEGSVQLFFNDGISDIGLPVITKSFDNTAETVKEAISSAKSQLTP